MNLEVLFSVAGTVAMLGWLALAAAPLRPELAQLVAARLVPLLLALAYAGLLAANWGGSEGGFGSLADVARLFATPGLLLAGWLHYLAFDLFVGAWMVREARRGGVPHLAVLPSLALTFLFGPVGLLAFFATRAALRRAPARTAERPEAA